MKKLIVMKRSLNKHFKSFGNLQLTLKLFIIYSVILINAEIRKNKYKGKVKKLGKEKKSNLILTGDKNRNSMKIYWYGLNELAYHLAKTRRKKILKVNYVDFWRGFDYKNHYIYQILSKIYKFEISQTPDYIFFAMHGFRHLQYFNKKSGPILIQCISENIFPEFNICDYSIGFNYLQFEDRYFRMPLGFYRALFVNLYKQRPYKKGKKFCGIVIRNGKTVIRNNFFKKLSEYKKVDSGGAFANNVGGWVKNKTEFLSNYKFSIQFENSVTNGYLTEKLIDGFEAQTIPIYHGDPTVFKYFNKKAFIYVKDEEDFPRAIEQIKNIDNNEELYKKMLKEPIFNDELLIHKETKKFVEFLCHIIDQEKEKARRTYKGNLRMITNYILGLSKSRYLKRKKENR